MSPKEKPGAAPPTAPGDTAAAAALTAQQQYAAAWQNADAAKYYAQWATGAAATPAGAAAAPTTAAAGAQSQQQQAAMMQQYMAQQQQYQAYQQYMMQAQLAQQQQQQQQQQAMRQPPPPSAAAPWRDVQQKPPASLTRQQQQQPPQAYRAPWNGGRSAEPSPPVHNHHHHRAHPRHQQPQVSTSSPVPSDSASAAPGAPPVDPNNPQMRGFIKAVLAVNSSSNKHQRAAEDHVKRFLKDYVRANPHTNWGSLNAHHFFDRAMRDFHHATAASAHGSRASSPGTTNARTSRASSMEPTTGATAKAWRPPAPSPAPAAVPVHHHHHEPKYIPPSARQQPPAAFVASPKHKLKQPPVAHPQNKKTAKTAAKAAARSSAAAASAMADLGDDAEAKKRERELRFRAQAQKVEAERAAARILASQNFAQYEEAHRAARGGDDEDGEAAIIGTSTALEKSYLRLTSAPNPADFRPLPVLEKAFAFLQDKWSAERNYIYMCDQLKALRQDLLVQRIQNEFTVQVYEMHARIALEMQDFGEFNQCQTQLIALYERGIRGCRMEFTAYRVLYYVFTKSHRDMKQLLRTLTPAEFDDHYVQQALAVRDAALRGDYPALFRAYRDADLLMGTYLLDPLLARERVKALWVLTKSHMTVPLAAVVVPELGWESPKDAIEFINQVVRKVWGGAGVDEYLVPADAASIEGRKLRNVMESYLTNFTKVDIKGQIA
ncbi:hypothetical protein H9P43_006349 [Blastocladiella emersonii ATCC 22665]|nr:hypothetical protein H9P43_006349 [Blastocladiella emersonii ATCC 22665]